MLSREDKHFLIRLTSAVVGVVGSINYSGEVQEQVLIEITKALEDLTQEVVNEAEDGTYYEQC